MSEVVPIFFPSTRTSVGEIRFSSATFGIGDRDALARLLYGQQRALIDYHMTPVLWCVRHGPRTAKLKIISTAVRYEYCLLQNIHLCSPSLSQTARLSSVPDAGSILFRLERFHCFFCTAKNFDVNSRILFCEHHWSSVFSSSSQQGLVLDRLAGLP